MLHNVHVLQARYFTGSELHRCLLRDLVFGAISCDRLRPFFSVLGNGSCITRTLCSPFVVNAKAKQEVEQGLKALQTEAES